MSFLGKIMILLILFQTQETRPLKEQIKEDKSPIEIKAKRLKIENQNKKATFSDNVVVTRSDMKMTCDLLMAFYNENGKIEKFECIGNVKLTKGERVATSNKAVYDNRNSTVIMTGNPYYSDGENRFWGDVVDYDLENDVVNVKNIKAVVKIKGQKEKK
ncbi:MAG: lipopolysaccharide transport periplasmic protein LptA [Myxococcota bacterium]